MAQQHGLLPTNNEPYAYYQHLRSIVRRYVLVPAPIPDFLIIASMFSYLAYMFAS